MEMIVHDDEKYVEIWLTNAESQDVALRESLKQCRQIVGKIPKRTKTIPQLLLSTIGGLLANPYKSRIVYYLAASSIATAHATVIPTMGLLPAPISPIIST